MIKWTNDTATPVQFPTLGISVDPGDSIELDEKDERVHGFLRSIGQMKPQTEKELMVQPADEPESGSVTASIRARVKLPKGGTNGAGDTNGPGETNGAGDTGGQDGTK